MSPYLATVLAGSDTYYGSTSAGSREADFLLQNNPSKADHKFWDQVDPSTYWDPIRPDYSQEHDWTHADRPTNQPVIGPAAYFNTLEHNLNTAIYYCAHTINYILNKVAYNGCECSGENPPGGQEPDPGQKEDVKEGVRVAVDEFQSLFVLGAIGLASTMITLTLATKLLSFVDKMIYVW
jgi:hypothetical protein